FLGPSAAPCVARVSSSAELPRPSLNSNTSSLRRRLLSASATTLPAASGSDAAAKTVENPNVDAHARWKPRVNPWLIAMTVALAAFMEVLDTSIANVALPHIGGSLGASTDEATWVLTSYLVSNAIVLPLGGWASSVMGRRNFFVFCITVFTIASFLCGIAPSLPILLLCRVLQGMFGGGMQPMAQAIMADSFEPQKRGQALHSTASSPCSRRPSAPH